MARIVPRRTRVTRPPPAGSTRSFEATLQHASRHIMLVWLAASFPASRRMMKQACTVSLASVHLMLMLGLNNRMASSTARRTLLRASSANCTSVRVHSQHQQQQALGLRGSCLVATQDMCSYAAAHIALIHAAGMLGLTCAACCSGDVALPTPAASRRMSATSERLDGSASSASVQKVAGTELA